MNRVFPWIAVTIIIVFHIFVDLWWIDENTAFNGVSEGDLVTKAFEFRDYWESDRIDREKWRYLFCREERTDTPRLLFLYGYWSMKIFGESKDALLYPMVIWHALLLLATYLFGRVTVGRRAALLGMAILSFMPQVFDFARSYSMYCASAAIYIFALVALVKSEGLTRLRPGIIFALLACLQMLTERGTPFIFLAGPLAVSIWPTARDIAEGRTRIFFWLNIAIGLALFYVLVWPYLLGYLSLTGGHIGERVTQSFFTPGDHWYDSNFKFLYYLVELGLRQAGLLATTVFYISLIALWKKPFLHRRIVIASLAVPFVIFTLIGTKDMTYVLAWLPLVALVAAHGVFSLPHKALRTCVAIFILAVSVFNFTSRSFGLDWIERANLGNCGKRPVVAFLTNWRGRFQPRMPDTSWRLEETAQKIVSTIDSPDPIYIHYRYRTGHIDPQYDLSFAVCFADSRIVNVIRFFPEPEDAPDRELTRITILPVGAWPEAIRTEDESLFWLLLKFDTGRFIEHNEDEQLKFDKYLESLDRREVMRGELAPGFPYRVDVAWPRE